MGIGGRIPPLLEALALLFRRIRPCNIFGPAISCKAPRLSYRLPVSQPFAVLTA
jgi:hypothetical protein